MLLEQRRMKSLSSICPLVRWFVNFLKIGSLVFFDIVHDESLPWYLVTDKTRFTKKKWQREFGPKSGPKLGFFAISSSLVH